MTQSELQFLRRLVEEYGLGKVLFGLADICDQKASIQQTQVFEERWRSMQKAVSVFAFAVETYER